MSKSIPSGNDLGNLKNRNEKTVLGYLKDIYNTLKGLPPIASMGASDLVSVISLLDSAKDRVDQIVLTIPKGLGGAGTSISEASEQTIALIRKLYREVRERAAKLALNLNELMEQANEIATTPTKIPPFNPDTDGPKD